MRASLTIVMLFFSVSAFLQEPAMNPVLTMGAYTPGFADAYSQFRNPAVIAAMKKRSAGLYAEQRFMVMEWKKMQAAFALPTAAGSFGLSLHYSGAGAYSALQTSLSYARSFNSGVYAGVQFHYRHEAVAGYGSSNGLGYTAAALFRLDEKLSAGISFSNQQSGFEKGKQIQRLPQIFCLGAGYKLSPLVFITTEISRQENLPVSITAGLHYAFHEKIFFRTAFESSTHCWQISGGIKWKLCCIQILTSLHPVLGLTPGLALAVEEKNREK